MEVEEAVETGIKIEQTVESAAETIASIAGFAVDKFLLVFEKAVAASPTLFWDFMLMDIRSFNLTGQHLQGFTSIFKALGEEVREITEEVPQFKALLVKTLSFYG